MNNKIRKIIIYLVIIVFILLFIFFLFFSPNKNQSKSTLPADLAEQLNKVTLKNEISSKINKVTFEISDQDLSATLPIYKLQPFNNSSLVAFAQKLNMNINDDDSALGTVGFKDSEGNSIKYHEPSKEIFLDNKSNVILNGFSKQTVLTKLSDLFNVDLSTYYLVKETPALDGKNTILTYSYKMKSYKLISDFNSEDLLTVYIAKDGALSQLNWNFNDFTSLGDYPLLKINYIKSNFSKISKGIYPNFSLQNSSLSSSNADTYVETENFEGDIKIEDVELVYLWSDSNKTLLIPAYRFKSIFTFTSGNVKDGVVIIRAVNY